MFVLFISFSIELLTVVRAANGTILHFRSSQDPNLVLDFHTTEACDICCRILFASNKMIEFLDEGETWKEPGKVIEYCAQAGRRNQGSVTSRIGAGECSSFFNFNFVLFVWKKFITTLVNLTSITLLLNSFFLLFCSYLFFFFFFFFFFFSKLQHFLVQK